MLLMLTRAFLQELQVLNSSLVGTAESLYCENMRYEVRITITLASLI